MKKILFTFLLLITFFMNVNASSSIDIKRKIDNVSEAKVTFYYELTPKDTNPAAVSDLNTTFEITFNEENITDSYAQQVYTLDFSNFTFTSLGKYEFVLSETSSSNSDYPVDNDQYTIVLNVLNEVDSNNEPTGNYVIDVLSSAFLNDTNGKANILFETNPLTYVTLSKTVTGDLANMNEYFKFKVNIITGSTFTIEGQDETVTYNGEVITTSNTFDPTIDNYVYLKHGQTITIGHNSETGLNELYSGINFGFEEMDASDYKTYINGSKNDYKISNLRASNIHDNNKLSYVNNQESTVLTGLFVSIVPFVILGILSLTFIVLVHRRNNAKDVK